MVYISKYLIMLNLLGKNPFRFPFKVINIKKKIIDI